MNDVRNPNRYLNIQNVYAKDLILGDKLVAYGGNQFSTHHEITEIRTRQDNVIEFFYNCYNDRGGKLLGLAYPNSIIQIIPKESVVESFSV